MEVLYQLSYVGANRESYRDRRPVEVSSKHEMTTSAPAVLGAFLWRCQGRFRGGLRQNGVRHSHAERRNPSQRGTQPTRRPLLQSMVRRGSRVRVPTSACRDSGRDQRGARDVGGDAARVTGQKRAASYGRMGADQEVGEHSLPCAAGPAIFSVSVAGEERGD
jgi:hypothetical protein